MVDGDNVVLSGMLAVSDNAFRHSRWRVYIKISQASSTRSAVEQKWSHRSFCCPFERDIPSSAMSSWSLYTRAEGRITNMQDGTVIRVTEANIEANPNAAPVQIGCGAGASNVGTLVLDPLDHDATHRPVVVAADHERHGLVRIRQ